MADNVGHFLNNIAFTRLREILNQRKNELTRHTDYDNPSWSHKQAHINGQLSEINQILNLIGDFKE